MLSFRLVCDLCVAAVDLGIRISPAQYIYNTTGKEFKDLSNEEAAAMIKDFSIRRGELFNTIEGGYDGKEGGQ